MSPSSPLLNIYCFASGNRDFSSLSAPERNWLEQNGFKGRAGHLLALPDGQGAIASYAFGMGDEQTRSPLLLGRASAQLPAGNYRLAGDFGDPELAFLAFGLGTYGFNRYRVEPERDVPELPALDEDGEIRAMVRGAFLARDLINTPANDLGPDNFEREIRTFARKRGMNCRSIAGDELLAQNFPMIHAVGRASEQAPRLLDLEWGKQSAPRVTLVGKGVTFDTGGLDIKPAAGMALMKKDMGGAANILGLAHLIVAGRLDVRLRVLLPVVENAISGSAFRPGDVLASRSGLNVEIGNTDAEGRLILADAITLACEEEPELLIDMATLTGAARVALGPDLPPLYSTNQELARQLVELGARWGDPLWHMPLWDPYDADLSSSVGDVSHISSAGGMAGSVTAALFLRRFVQNAGDWLHLDIYGWRPKAQPGRSKGGTDQGMRALYALLKQRYGVA